MATEWSGYFSNASAQRYFFGVRSMGNPSLLSAVVHMASKPFSAKHPNHVHNLAQPCSPSDHQTQQRRAKRPWLVRILASEFSVKEVLTRRYL